MALPPSVGCAAARQQGAVARRLSCPMHQPAPPPPLPRGTASLALSFLGEDLLMQLDDLHLGQAQAVRRPALLNIAACQLRQVWGAVCHGCARCAGGCRTRQRRRCGACAAAAHGASTCGPPRKLGGGFVTSGVR